MNKEPSFEQCLPSLTGSVRFHAYTFADYVVNNDHVFGLPKGQVLMHADTQNVHARFHELFPEYENHEYLSKHKIRRIAYEKTVGRGDLMHSVPDGVELVKDMLSAYALCKDNKREELIESALQLSRKYGLLTHQPASVDADSKELSDMLGDGGHWNVEQEHIWFSFSLTDFHSRLVRLRILYLCWRVLFWGVNTSAKRELNLLLGKYYGLYELCRPPYILFGNQFVEGQAPTQHTLTDTGIGVKPSYSVAPFAYDESDYRKVIEQESNCWTPAIVLTFDADRPIRVYSYDTVLAAATGCMLEIISRGKDGLLQRTMDSCSRCGTPFIKEHGRQRFCSECGSNTVRVREHRARRAKEVQDGEKTREQ